ncbi:MAG: UBX domain-containing protein 6 [Paramarteilia canceri]
MALDFKQLLKQRTKNNSSSRPPRAVSQSSSTDESKTSNKTSLSGPNFKCEELNLSQISLINLQNELKKCIETHINSKNLHDIVKAIKTNSVLNGNNPNVAVKHLEIASKLIENIATDPSNIKYRKINSSSKALESFILPSFGGKELLEALEFKMIEDGIFFEFLGNDDIDIINQTLKILKETKPYEWFIERDTIVSKSLNLMTRQPSSDEDDAKIKNAIKNVYQLREQKQVFGSGLKLSKEPTSVPYTYITVMINLKSEIKYL